MPNMQPPLRPIRPALSLLRLLCLALVLFPSFADHFGGASSVKGVLAAPASPNLPPTRDGVLPAAPASPNLLPTRDGVLPAAPASSNLPPTSDNVLPAAPARSPNQIPHSDSDGPVEVEFYLFRRDRSTGKRQEGKPSSPTENWQGRVGELFTFKRDKRGISVTYGKELEDFAKERHARVALRVGGQPLGKITFKSRTAMKESSGRVTKDLGTSYGQRRGLLFITHGIDLLEKEKDVTVEMDREYYVLVREMLRIEGGGDGYVLSESDHATRAFYADMEARLTLALDWGLSEEELARFSRMDW